MESSKKTALLVGISGIGKKLYLPLSELGFRNAVISYHSDRNAAEAWSTDASIYGIETKLLHLDATDPENVRAAVDETLKLAGRIDAVIVLLGSFQMKTPTSYTPNEWKSLFATNVDAPYYIAQQVLPHLEQTRGSLLFFGVAHADQLHSQPMTMPYAAAKTALLVMMRTLARTEAHFGVRINMISPGLMNNEKQSVSDVSELSKQVPNGRTGTADDVNAAVKYLLSEEASYVTGNNLILSGGWTI